MKRYRNLDIQGANKKRKQARHKKAVAVHAAASSSRGLARAKRRKPKQEAYLQQQLFKEAA
jgi:hypothetical protein